jgi:hypothetical protein
MIGPANGMTTSAAHQRVFPTRLQIEIAGMRLIMDQNAKGKSCKTVSVITVLVLSDASTLVRAMI